MSKERSEQNRQQKLDKIEKYLNLDKLIREKVRSSPNLSQETNG